MKCWVKSRNERNPYPLLPARDGGNSKETAGDKPEEGGDDVKSSWPLRVGLHTRATMADTKRSDLARAKAELIKSVVVRIESATRLHEVGIASNRRSECYGEYVPGPCTHRPSHHGSGLQKK